MASGLGRRLGLVLAAGSLGLGLGGGLVSLIAAFSAAFLAGAFFFLGVVASPARAALGLGQRGVEQVQLARLGLLDLQRALGAGQTLELLPVAGDLQQLQDGLGGLGADAEPVLGPLRVDLDEARLFLRVVPADDLDGAAVAAGARVGDGDAVLGIADLAKPGELDLDSHDEAILL